MIRRRGLTAHMRIKPEKREEFLRLQAGLVAHVRESWPAALFLDYFECEDDPGSVQFMAVFADDASYEAFRHSDYHRACAAPLHDCLAEPLEMIACRPLN